MTLALAIIVGILGAGLIIFGLGYYTVFRFGLAMFERALKAEVAQYGRDQVESAAMKISNPMVRRFVQRHLVATGGAMAVSIVRDAIASRMRTGLYVVGAGLIALIASFYTGTWLPMIWQAG